MSEAPLYERRQFLAQLVKFLFVVGILAFVGVVLVSLTSTRQTEDNKLRQGIEVDVSYLKTGQLKKVSAGHKEVWIFHRSACCKFFCR